MVGTRRATARPCSRLTIATEETGVGVAVPHPGLHILGEELSGPGLVDVDYRREADTAQSSRAHCGITNS